MKIDFVEVYINKADALLQLNRWVGLSEMQHVQCGTTGLRRLK